MAAVAAVEENQNSDSSITSPNLSPEVSDVESDEDNKEREGDVKIEEIVIDEKPVNVVVDVPTPPPTLWQKMYLSFFLFSLFPFFLIICM